MALTREAIIQLGYIDARQLPSGEWIALGSSIYTLDLYIGIDETGWRCKWMYPAAYGRDAGEAFKHWNGTGHPPGSWVKRKDKHGDAWHPNAYRPELDHESDQLVACEDGSVRKGKP